MPYNFDGIFPVAGVQHLEIPKFKLTGQSLAKSVFIIDKKNALVWNYACVLSDSVPCSPLSVI